MSAASPMASTPPPALTWLHLLPSRTQLCCASGPDWWRSQLGEYSIADGAPIQVSWGEPGDVASQPAGLVAINSRRLSDQQLRSTGFKYVRRFAAMPSLRNLRWLVPLDSPAISSAAFSLYTPARLSAKLKRFAVRVATYTRLPVWYRDQVCIALPEAPPLERAMAGLFPGEGIRLALSSGAPEGAINRKASALVIGKSGKLLAFAKLARSAIARRILANEADALPRLAPLAVPRLLLCDEIDGTRVLAQTPLPGRPAPLDLGEPHRRFLKSLQTEKRDTAANVAMVKGLGQRLAALSPARQDLIEILANILPALESFAVPVTVVHGDFAPWNLRVHEGKVAAFDWEYAEVGGLPLIDEIHYRLQVGMMLEQWDVSTAGRFLAGLAASRPLNLEPSHVDAIAVIYLLDALARLLGEGYGAGHEMITWHRELLNRAASRFMTRPREEVAA